MARPTEKSLSFFNHDTDARSDRKLKLFVRYTGLPGYGFYWAILEEIYKEHYFIEWTKEDEEAFVAEFHSPFFELTVENIKYLIEQAAKFGLIDGALFETHNILTSASAQSRWLKASSRRMLAEMRDDFLLINVGDFYKKELQKVNLSIKVVDKNGATCSIYGEYEDDDNNNQVSDNNNGVDDDDNVDNSDEYDEKYDFSREYPWDGEQPIDYAGCIETWNKITGGRARTTRIPKSKKTDLRRVFRNYTGAECFEALHVRCQNDQLQGSKYMTDWSTLFGAKRLENLDKWVDRAREWREDQNKMETAKEHFSAGWITQREAQGISDAAGVELEDPMFWETKSVESQMLYYPKFDH